MNNLVSSYRADDKNIGELLMSINCPISSELLTEAVTLSPCCHKINQMAAEKLYGKIKNDECSEKSKECAVCRKIVKAWYVDDTFRNIVSKILEVSEPEKLLLEHSKHPVVIEGKKDLLPPPYPGKEAKFTHHSGDWRYFDGELGLIKRLEFVRSIETPDAFIQKFSLLCYRDESICIRVEFNKNDTNVIRDYLSSINIEFDEYDLSLNRIFVTEKEQRKRIFSIIAQNNEIPEEYFHKIKEILELGVCEIDRSERQDLFEPAYIRRQSLYDEDSRLLFKIDDVQRRETPPIFIWETTTSRINRLEEGELPLMEQEPIVSPINKEEMLLPSEDKRDFVTSDTSSRYINGIFESLLNYWM